MLLWVCQRPNSRNNLPKKQLYAPRLSHMGSIFGIVATAVIVWNTTSAYAQTLLASDDQYGIQFGTSLLVEPNGVLDNDTLNGEPAGENGASAELLTPPQYGTLSCPANAGRLLCADGSFDYAPTSGFNGLDSFTYQAVFNSTVSGSITVKLSACIGGPLIFSCWKEAAYLDKLAELGYGVFNEGFEGSAWDSVRSTISTPNTAASVTSQNIIWTTNHAQNNITTSQGAARSGGWGGYDASHGAASGTPANCDIDTPPVSCLYYDGLSGRTVQGGPALQAVGAYVRGTYGAKMAMILDNGVPINMGLAGFYEEQFHGVISTAPGGFSKFEFRETDGKVGQGFLVFFDDFRISASGSPANIVPVAVAGADQAVSVTDTVALDGGASYDANNDAISYNWLLTSKPAGSIATLSDTTLRNPSFVADQAGRYSLQLIVSDDVNNSLPDTLEVSATLSSTNQPPVADAGQDQTALPGDIVLLDGSASSDANNDVLSYQWTFIEFPAASNASLSNSNTVNPGFVADIAGRYIAQLVVSDASSSSDPDSIVINVAARESCQFFVIRSATGNSVIVCL